MIKKNKLLSLLLVLLMLIVAAASVNKAIFGHRFGPGHSREETVSDNTEAAERQPDGTIVIHTANIEGTTTGYAGDVPLDIYITDGKISDIKALPNVETPSFFRRASALLESWVGKTPQEALDTHVDAISGATYSSIAIISNVNKGLALYAETDGRQTESVPLKIWIAFAVTLAACIIPLFVKNRIYHTAQLVANVIVLGFWCGQFLDYTLILKYISDGLTWPLGLTAAAMLIAAFIYPLFGRPQHYCNHVCPLGAAQMLMAQICGYKIRIPHKILKALDLSRRIIWAVLMLLLWTDCLTGWMDLELFQAFQFRSASWWIIGAACGFVALSTVIARPYCRFLCPTGSLFKRAENIS